MKIKLTGLVKTLQLQMLLEAMRYINDITVL